MHTLIACSLRNVIFWSTFTDWQKCKSVLAKVSWNASNWRKCRRFIGESPVFQTPFGEVPASLVIGWAEKGLSAVHARHYHRSMIGNDHQFVWTLIKPNAMKRIWNDRRGVWREFSDGWQHRSISRWSCKKLSLWASRRWRRRRRRWWCCWSRWLIRKNSHDDATSPFQIRQANEWLLELNSFSFHLLSLIWFPWKIRSTNGDCKMIHREWIERLRASGCLSE